MGEGHRRGEGEMSGKYGLHLRNPSSQKAASRPPLRPSVFADDDDDDVEREISRQASKNKALQKVEELHKKALEDDPLVFNYDGVYDEMKQQQTALPRMQDRVEGKPKYIEEIMKNCKERNCEQEIIYERKLLKERSKEDPLYKDKDKFVTTAYKKHLAEQEQFLKEDNLRRIREEKEDVTKKSDLSDFYFSLNKNIAFGGFASNAARPAKEEGGHVPPQLEHEANGHPKEDTDGFINQVETSEPKTQSSDHVASSSGHTVNGDTNAQESKQGDDLAMVKEMTNEHYKRTTDDLAAARERFLARKKSKI